MNFISEFNAQTVFVSLLFIINIKKKYVCTYVGRVRKEKKENLYVKNTTRKNIQKKNSRNKVQKGA